MRPIKGVRNLCAENCQRTTSTVIIPHRIAAIFASVKEGQPEDQLEIEIFDVDNFVLPRLRTGAGVHKNERQKAKRRELDSPAESGHGRRMQKEIRELDRAAERHTV